MLSQSGRRAPYSWFRGQFTGETGTSARSCLVNAPSRIKESFRAVNTKRETYFGESCERVFLCGMIAHNKEATQKPNHGIKAPEELGTSHVFLELERTW